MTLLDFKNKTTIAKCDNKKCSNFTTNHDLHGSWCMDECFIENESGERITHIELLKMKVDYDWDMTDHEKSEIKHLQIVKDQNRINNDH
jgi:hypothetical protein